VYGEISGAAVTLTNNGADEARKVQSDPAGNYAAVNLEAGRYEAAIENSGFGKAVTKDVVLSAREIARVGARLEIAAAVRCSRRGT